MQVDYLVDDEGLEKLAWVIAEEFVDTYQLLDGICKSMRDSDEHESFGSHRIVVYKHDDQPGCKKHSDVWSFTIPVACIQA